MTTAVVEKLTRQQQVDALRARDGDTCKYPGCGEVIDFDIKDGPWENTIDHWMPQHYGKAAGWSWEQIWDLDNLVLMHKKCNAKKGDRIPNDDGTLPEKVVRKFRYRRDKRAERPELCTQCDNGNNLAIDEVCGSCGSDAKRMPRWAKVQFKDCDHEVFWCWVCCITPEMRPASIGTAMRQGDSDELGEWQVEEE